MSASTPVGVLAAAGLTQASALAPKRPHAVANLRPVERLAASSVDMRPSCFHAERANRARGYLSSTFTTVYLCPPTDLAFRIACVFALPVRHGACYAVHPLGEMVFAGPLVEINNQEGVAGLAEQREGTKAAETVWPLPIAQPGVDARCRLLSLPRRSGALAFAVPLHVGPPGAPLCAACCMEALPRCRRS